MTVLRGPEWGIPLFFALPIWNYFVCNPREFGILFDTRMLEHGIFNFDNLKWDFLENENAYKMRIFLFF